MKKIIIIFTLLVFNSIINAQQIYPLDTNTDNLPDNSYIKDTNNVLSNFTGIYHANYKNLFIQLYITKIEDKEIKYPKQIFYKDVIMIKFKIQDSSGNILQNTVNTSLSEKVNRIQSFDYDSQNNELFLSYTGTNCDVGWGEISLKKINNNQISWKYKPNDTTLYNCPENADTNIYLPISKNLIFNKQ